MSSFCVSYIFEEVEEDEDESIAKKLTMDGFVVYPPFSARRYVTAHLDLSDNKLQGTIPFEMSNLKLLTNLELDSNALTGNMPFAVCSQLPFLENAVVDCDDVVCWCCEGCTIDLRNAITPFDEP